MRLKWAYAVLSAVAAAASVAVLLEVQLGLTGDAVRIVRVGGGVAFVGASVVGLVWLARAWGGIPFQLARGVSADDAVWRLFIPIYGLYWMFEVHRRICAAIDAALPGTTRRRVLHGLAGIAPLVTLLTWVVPKDWGLGWGLGPALASVFWLPYMLRCDEARHEAWEPRLA